MKAGSNLEKVLASGEFAPERILFRHRLSTTSSPSQSGWNRLEIWV